MNCCSRSVVEECRRRWLPPLTRAAGAAPAARARRPSRISADAPVESARHAAPADGRASRDLPSARPTSTKRHRPAGRRGLRPERRSRRRRPRASREARRASSSALTRSTRRRASISPTASTSAAGRPSTCCRTCSRALLRGLSFPKHMRWDALARRRQGRADVRPADSLAAVSLRRPRRAVRRSAAAPSPQSPRVQDVRSGAVTYGHRFLATSGRAGRAIKVRTFDDYRAQAGRALRPARAR